MSSAGDHPITMVTSDGSCGGIGNGQPIAFRCDGCGNLDEDLFEVIHDEVCDLAEAVRPYLIEVAREGTATRGLLADGGWD